MTRLFGKDAQGKENARVGGGRFQLLVHFLSRAFNFRRTHRTVREQGDRLWMQRGKVQHRGCALPGGADFTSGKQEGGKLDSDDRVCRCKQGSPGQILDSRRNVTFLKMALAEAGEDTRIVSIYLRRI